MSFTVDVLVPVTSQKPRPDMRHLVPSVEHRTLSAAKTWLGAHRHAFRAWLAETEPYYEAWVYDAEGDPVYYERCSRESFGPADEVLHRTQIREMRKKKRRALASEAASGPVSATSMIQPADSGHDLTHVTNGHCPSAQPTLLKRASGGEINGKHSP